MDILKMKQKPSHTKLESPKEVDDIAKRNQELLNKYYSKDFSTFFYNVYKKIAQTGKSQYVDKNYMLVTIIFNMYAIISLMDNKEFKTHIVGEFILYELTESINNSNFVLMFIFKILNSSKKLFNLRIKNNEDLTIFLKKNLYYKFENDENIMEKLRPLNDFIDFIKLEYHDPSGTLINTIEVQKIEKFSAFYNNNPDYDYSGALYDLLATLFEGDDIYILHILNSFDNKIVYKNVESMFTIEPLENIGQKGDLELYARLDQKDLLLSIERQNQELKNIAELIKKGQTTPQEYVNNILNKPEFLTNLKRLAIEHPAIFNEMNKLGVIGLLKGDVSAEQYKQISNIREEVRPYIIDGKYKLNTNKIILKKIDSIKRKKY
jgi:hypothetical protein